MMDNCLFGCIALLVYLPLAYLAVAVLTWIVCGVIGYNFTWGLCTAIWLVIMAIKLIF